MMSNFQLLTNNLEELVHIAIGMQGDDDSLSSGRAFFTGYCPDKVCQTKLVFPREESIECTQCGQRFPISKIKNVQELRNPEYEIHNILRSFLFRKVKPTKGPEDVRLLGLSNYVCKLLSPILTRYGMDKLTGRAKLLTEMGQGELFDCSVLGDRAFLIDPDHLGANGYGKDRTGSVSYLADTLAAIKKVNNDEERLVPIHSDGDGHCLVHAISRALVGRELFWHALRMNLKNHFTSNLPKYKELFIDFVSENEWRDIIAECDPDFVPPEMETLGLRNMHIFGLANVLHRPIILLDSLSGMDSSGDYSAVFLPVLVDAAKCRGKSGKLHPPLCIAWSNSGHNHFVPLVGIKGKELPLLPAIMTRRAWGVSTSYIRSYLELNDQEQCVVGGNNCLQEKYVQRLVTAMEAVFLEKYGVSAKLVADFQEEFYRNLGIVGMKPWQVRQMTAREVQRKGLYRCLVCEALSKMDLQPEWFRCDGQLHKLAIKTYGKLEEHKIYEFPLQGAICTYDPQADELCVDLEKSYLAKCSHCQSTSVRLVLGDGSLKYRNGDRTLTPTTTSSCTCGFKHYYNGKEYDNVPNQLRVKFEWNGKEIEEYVLWFQNESDPDLNSNVFTIAQTLVQKHFPGEFGSERLVQKVVDILLRQTAIREDPAAEAPKHPEPASDWSAESPTKIIITGQQHKSIHKEELTKSETERALRRRIEQNAAKQQHRQSQSSQSSQSSPEQSPASSSGRRPLSASRAEPKMAAAAAAPASRPASAEPRPEESSDIIKIKLVTPSGQQVCLDLSKKTTYAELQQKVAAQAGIPIHRQRLRVGFPPRELHPPQSGSETTPIPLQHGDKLTVDEMKEAGTSKNGEPHASGVTSDPSPKNRWSKFSEEAEYQSADAMLDGLERNHNKGSDDIDVPLHSLQLMAMLTGKDMWSHVQAIPHLFSVGGTFFQIMERDVGLVDQKHISLPALPGKIFVYNARANRLELCLEPHGHFPIEPNVEDKARTQPLAGGSDGAGSHVKFGASGALAGRGHDQSSHTTAFAGHGHSLRGDIAMPADLLPVAHHHGARTLGTLCTDSPHQSTIPEDMEVEDPSPAVPVDATSYRKLGPGFSVLSQSATNEVNRGTEELRALASQIQHSFSSSLDAIEEDRENSVEPSSQLDEEPNPKQAGVDKTCDVPCAEATEADVSDTGSLRALDAAGEVARSSEKSGGGDGLEMQDDSGSAGMEEEVAVVRHSPTNEACAGDLLLTRSPGAGEKPCSPNTQELQESSPQDSPSQEHQEEIMDTSS